jgi:hypothetical protein
MQQHQVAGPDSLGVFHVVYVNPHTGAKLSIGTCPHRALAECEVQRLNNEQVVTDALHSDLVNASHDQIQLNECDGGFQHVSVFLKKLKA